MTLARNVPSARIVPTEPDLFGCLDNLKRNVETNLDAGVVEAARVSCTPFDWSDTTAAVLLERWDLVLGSDLIYNRETVRLLPPVLASLIRNGCKVVYCQTLYRWGAFGWDLPFYEALCAHGLRCSVRWLEPELHKPTSPGANGPERAERSEPRTSARPRDLDQRACVMEIVAAAEAGGHAARCDGDSEVRALFARAHERKREQDAWLSATTDAGQLAQMDFISNLFVDDGDPRSS
jgi:hypothetical protein